MIPLGSSDAPAILGVSPRLTPWQLWAQKVGIIEAKDEPDEIMLAGTALEPVVVDLFLAQMGWPDLGLLRSPDTTRFHDVRSWQRATPDAVRLNAYGSAGDLIEVKCVVGHPPSAPRVDWLVQCLHQRLVYEEASAQWLVAFGNLQLVWWEIPRHPRALDAVLRAEERFLQLVETETPPPVRAEDAAPLSRAWPLVLDAVRELEPETLAWDAARVRADEQITKWKRVKGLADARLKAAIGDHQRAVLPDGTTYTFRPHPVKSHVLPARTDRPLRRRGGDDE